MGVGNVGYFQKTFFQRRGIQCLGSLGVFYKLVFNSSV